MRNLTNYGAFIEIEEGIDGLLHVSDMSWTRKISHPSEVVEKGQEIECKVLSVDQHRRRIALGLKQLEEDPWANDIPDRYQAGQLVLTKGRSRRSPTFGVFVGLEDGLEGLLHISELADHKVENPEEIVKVGDEIEVKSATCRHRRTQDRLVAQARRMGRRQPRPSRCRHGDAASAPVAERPARPNSRAALAVRLGPVDPTRLNETEDSSEATPTEEAGESQRRGRKAPPATRVEESAIGVKLLIDLIHPNSGSTCGASFEARPVQTARLYPARVVVHRLQRPSYP